MGKIGVGIRTAERLSLLDAQKDAIKYAQDVAKEEKAVRKAYLEEKKWKKQALAEDQARRDAQAPDYATRMNYENEYKWIMDNEEVVRRSDYGYSINSKGHGELVRREPVKPKTRTTLAQQETTAPVNANKQETIAPTNANQQETTASKKSSIPSGQPAQNTSMFGAKVKALRSQGGKADIQAAKRLEGEHTAFMELINNGQHKEAAEMIGATGDFSSNIAGLRKQGDKYFAGQAAQGPAIQDYIFGHKVISTTVGLGIAGGAIAAVYNNGGRRSNADLYSSPF